MDHEDDCRRRAERPVRWFAAPAAAPLRAGDSPDGGGLPSDSEGLREHLQEHPSGTTADAGEAAVSGEGEHDGGEDAAVYVHAEQSRFRCGCACASP